MKTYKTWEAFKMITENNRLKFKCSEYDIILKWKGDVIRFFEEDKNVQRYGVMINDKWILIEEPVDFMTAVKSGKKIRVEYDLMSHLKIFGEYLTLVDLLDILSYSYPSSTIREILTEGKFYIEDNIE